MNQRIPFLEELKRELMDHAFQQAGTAPRPMRRRFRLRGALVAATAFMVVLLLGGLSLILADSVSRDTTVEEPSTQLGPELIWRQVEAPTRVDKVRSLWSLPGGFALWTGEAIRTSTDGENWRLAASAPPVNDTNQGNVVARIDDEWLVAGAADNGTPLIAATSNGETWTTSALPVPSPTNALLASRVEIVAVVSGPHGVVAVGAVTTGVNQETVIDRFAPDLSDGQIRHRDDMIEILEADGTVRISVPYGDIDEALAEQGGVILETIIWHSPDAQSWNQVDLIEGAGPSFLGADFHSYTLAMVQRDSPLTSIVTSDNGVDWNSPRELQEPVSGMSFALLGEELIAGGQNVSLVRVQPDGATQLISTGPAFDDSDLHDLTVGQVTTGEYGVVVAAYNHTRESVPYVALWYSPDGEQWNRQNTIEIFGGEVNLQVAVGDRHGGRCHRSARRSRIGARQSLPDVVRDHQQLGPCVKHAHF